MQSFFFVMLLRDNLLLSIKPVSSRGVASHRKPAKDVITLEDSAAFARRSLAPAVRISETTFANMDEITKSYTVPRQEADCRAPSHARPTANS